MKLRAAIEKKSVKASADSASALFRPRPETETELGLCYYEKPPDPHLYFVSDLSRVSTRKSIIHLLRRAGIFVVISR